MSADSVMKLLGTERSHNTNDLRIGGGRDFPDASGRDAVVKQLAEQYALSADVVTQLLDRYGCNRGMLKCVAADNGAQTLQSIANYRIGEVRYMCEHEFVAHLDDILFRRSTLALVGRAADAVITEIASIAAPIMGWDAAAEQAEIARCQQFLNDAGRTMALS